MSGLGDAYGDYLLPFLQKNVESSCFIAFGLNRTKIRPRGQMLHRRLLTSRRSHYRARSGFRDAHTGRYAPASYYVRTFDFSTLPARYAAMASTFCRIFLCNQELASSSYWVKCWR